MVEVETYDYDDGGFVRAEMVITLEGTEFVVVSYEGGTSLTLFQRNIGEQDPHTRYTEDGAEKIQ